MARENVNDNLFDSLDELLKETDVKETKATDDEGFKDLPAGYYLFEVADDSELNISKNSGNPQVKLSLKVVEAYKIDDDTDEFVEMKTPKHTYKYFPLKDSEGILKLSINMKKFEDPDKPGEPIFGESDFKNSKAIRAMIEDAIGLYIWGQVTVSEKNGEKSSFTNLMSWKRAIDLGLADEE